MRYYTVPSPYRRVQFQRQRCISAVIELREAFVTRTFPYLQPSFDAHLLQINDKSYYRCRGKKMPRQDLVAMRDSALKFRDSN